MRGEAGLEMSITVTAPRFFEATYKYGRSLSFSNARTFLKAFLLESVVMIFGAVLSEMSITENLKERDVT